MPSSATTARAPPNSPMLVFLNNDIRMIDAKWLKTLVRLAMKPQVGVVGAKLLFPNRKIQHAGIVLGMGGSADISIGDGGGT